MKSMKVCLGSRLGTRQDGSRRLGVKVLRGAHLREGVTLSAASAASSESSVEAIASAEQLSAATGKVNCDFV